MLTLDECVAEIVRIAMEEQDPVERSLAVADAYLASIRDPVGTGGGALSWLKGCASGDQ